MRIPSRMNHDITVFKNFPIGKGAKKLQFRAGAFNIFNQAVPGFSTGQDLDLRLETACNVRVNGVPNGSGGTTDNVCDPDRGLPPDRQLDPELRQDHPAARPPRDRVRPEVLLLGRNVRSVRNAPGRATSPPRFCFVGAARAASWSL